MIVTHLHRYTNGWFIGDFTPSLIQTPFMEAGIIYHKKNDYWPAHYHLASDEVTVLLEGSMTINGLPVYQNSIFVISKLETAKVEFLTDCKVLVIRVPSIKGDKVTI
jgi:hypothetical protein